MYEAVWHRGKSKDKQAVDNVGLFLPAVKNAVNAPVLSVAYEASLKHSHEAIADLEITTEVTP